MEYKNAGVTWTPEMEDQLIALLKAGKPLSIIADECGRSPTAIVARMEYLAETAVRFEQLKKVIVANL